VSVLRRLAAAAGFVMAVSAASGQAVYRCEINGKASYSHESCGVTTAPRPAASKPPAAHAFRCDGRLYCSQMTSCREAKLFLKHCPGVKMDGDRDGVPCEQQWCTGR
jgi:hypothetical protein